MSNISKVLEGLSPEQRKLFMLKLNNMQQKKESKLTIQPGMRGDHDEFPLAFAQERIWFLEQLEPGNAFYNISAAVRLKGTLHCDALEKALNVLVERHESLRTTFVSRDRLPRQIIASQIMMTLPLYDFSDQPETQRESLVRKQALELAQRPFDLTHGPLLCSQIYRLQEQEHVLVLTMHHIISDGWSMSILIRELAGLYAASVQGQPVTLPELPIHYADYAGWQRQRLQGERIEQHLAYWKQQLEGAPALLNLPTDRPRSPVQSHRGMKEAVCLSLEVSQALKSLSHQEEMTPFMVLLASWAIFLQRLSGQDDVVIGSPIAGRQFKELEGLIGLFVNTLALRIDLAGALTFRQVLERVRKVTLGAYDHQEAPFEKIVEELAPQRDLSHHALFQVMFILQNMPKAVLHSSNLIMESVTIDNQTAKYDLELSLNEIAGHFEGYLEYSADLFDAETIQRWLQQWGYVLQYVLSHCNDPLTELALMRPEETLHVLQASRADIQSLPSQLQALLIDQNNEIVEYRLLDEQGQLAPVGVVGELSIGTGKSGEELPQRTGWLLRYCADGTLDYIGHRIQQVFMHGYALNLREIEQELMRLPGVRACVVRTKERAEGDLDLVAYVESQDRTLTAENVRQALKERVPGYKMPARFVCLEQLPRTSNGEVDYAALPEPSESVSHSGIPRTPVEETLVAIWADVLQVEAVGIYDNFFDLGGHSLLATQVVARIGEAFSRQFGSMSAEVEGEFINALFEEPTIAALALLIETVWQRELGVQLPVLEPVGREESLPLSFTQERMWFLDQLEPGNAFYNISAAVRLRGPLDVGALEQSLNRLIARHESLRTTFTLVDGAPRQVIVPHLFLQLHHQDVINQPAEQREAFAQQQAVEMAQVAFDLERGPLVRAQLYTLQAQEHILVLTMHHIISDGWSMGVLLRELSQFYAATVRGQTATLPELPIQYGDYAVWQRTWLQGEALDYQIAYWRTLLQKAPPLLGLPTDYARPPVQSHRGAKVLLQLSPDISQAIKLMSRREGMTPFMLLLTTWAILLGRLSGQEDLIIGSPIAGRKRVELEGLIGFFVNTLALRIDLSGDPTFHEVLERVRTMALGAYAHQELPFEKLVEELAPRRDLSYHPLFQVMFILQNTPKAVLHASDLTLEAIAVDNQTAKYDLELALEEMAGHFEGYLEYSTDCFEPTTVERWLQQWQRIVEAMLADIEQPIASVSWMSQEEEQRLVQAGEAAILRQSTEIERLATRFQKNGSDPVAYQIRDMQGRLVPVGVVGELFLSQASAGMFQATGEMGRYRADGTLEYRGSSDEQVGLNGFSVNLYELERTLVEVLALEACAVTLRESKDADAELVAYLVAPEARKSSEQVRSIVRAHLPAYKVPTYFVWLDALPLDSDGRVGRKALPEPSERASHSGIPRTPVEETLVAIWADVLQVETVGIYDNFFELGGHSLLATQVVARLEEALGEQLGQASAELEGVLINALFEEPTIIALAACIEQAWQQDLGVQLPELVSVPRVGTLPLSFTQERLWFLDQLEPGSTFYNNFVVVRLHGSLQGEVLERSLNVLVARHESLRTTFVDVEGQAGQLIAPHLELVLSYVDVSGMQEEQREQIAQEQAFADAQLPFDLAHGPLLRGKLICLHEQEYVLALTIHHIISDGWSMEILVRELSALYLAFVHGQSSPLPDLSLQYADYAVWQRMWLQGEALAQQVNYWRTLLQGAPALLELPTDHPRPPVQRHRGAKEPVKLSLACSQKLKRLSQQEGVTPYMMLLTAWVIQLGRLSGQDDLVIGTPIAGRKRVELEALIGFFVNTLALRINLSGNPTFREVLERVRSVALGAYVHQELPFEKLVEELAPQRDLSHQPLFQVMFILQNTPRSALAFSELSVEVVELDNPTAKFDLTLELFDHEAALEGHLEYNTDLFEATTMQRWVRQWLNLLEQALIDIDQPIASLPLMDEQEQQNILTVWNATAQVLPELQDLVSLFEAQERRTPHAIALLFEHEQISYYDLNRRANQLAKVLQSMGVTHETRVGVCLTRTPDLVVVLLAILKAGGAYVPLDPVLPSERLVFMLNNAQAQMLITDSSLDGGVDNWSGTYLYLDRQEAALAQYEQENLELALRPQQLAYVLYTSGSTGQPKGVMGTHQGIVNRLQWAWLKYPYAQGEVCCQKTSLSFVDAVAELFGPLLAGVPTVLIPDAESKDAERLLAVLAQHQVSRVVLVPGLLRTWLALEPHLGVRLPQMRLWMCSGESLSAEVWQQFRAACPGHQLINIYGSSEVAADATAYQLQGEHVAIGRPLGNVRVYVVDTHGFPSPLGAVGEIYVGGLGVARGYIQQADSTADRFVPDAYSGEAGARLYRTGDLGRYRSDGTLEYIGRRDQQVKLRGFRIELSEIEAALLTIPGIRVAAVQPLPSPTDDISLIAFIEADTMTSDQIRAVLQTRLPAYMLPQRFIIRSRLPLTASGKIDRVTLVEQVAALQQEHKSFIAPHTPEELLLAEIWAEVLHLERVSADDNFFEAGGHSLLATQIVARIRERFSISLSLQSLFEAPTLAAQARILTDYQQEQQPVRDLIPLQRVSRIQPVKLSFAQERMWFLDQLEPGNAFYIISAALRLQGILQKDALEASLNDLVARHESLRTTFKSINGSPVQEIASQLHLVLSVVDMYQEPVGQHEQVIRRMAQEVSAQPFDLAQGPLVRAHLYGLEEQTHVLVLTIHHIIADGWSMGVMIRELVALYEARVQGHSSSLSALAVQYADYASWQRTWLQGEVLDQQLGYWRKSLQGAPALLELPGDRARPQTQSYRGGKEAIRLSPEVSQALKTFSQHKHVTPFMVLLSAWAILLGRLSGQEDLVIGSPIAGRQQKELEALIGFFINTLAFRIDLSGQPTFNQILERARTVALGAFDNQDVPFEKLVEELSPERNLNIPPIFQAMFILQNASISSVSLPELSIEPLLVDGGFTQYDVVLDLSDTPQGFIGRLDYNVDLFDVHTVQRWVKLFQSLVVHVLERPDQALVTLPLLHKDELSCLLQQWQAQAIPPPAVQHALALFETQAEHAPMMTAVIAAEQQISYSELNARANQLARVLHRQGVMAETRVGVCCSRSIDLIVALLGIWKAGGAYVPLDPDLPSERIAFMFSNAEVTLVIMQPQYAASLETLVIPLFCLEQEAATLQAESAENPGYTLSPEQAAYVLYTSGSTGVPKGVVVEHRNLLHSYSAWKEAYGMGKSHLSHLQMANVTFDVFSGDLVRALCSGDTLVLCARDLLLEPEQLYHILQQHTIGCAEFVPVVMRGLLEYLERSKQNLSFMRVLAVGSESWTAQEYQRLQDLCGENTLLVNSYGVSEATIDSTFFTDHGTDLLPTQAVPIGRPFANVRIYVLNRYGQLVPIGAIGELYIGGPGVARGYAGRADLTAERFIPDVWSGEVGSRLYRTGDLVCYRADGLLEFVGRSDHQIKLRGYRIELAEIEAALIHVPEVQGSAVVVSHDQHGNQQLVAFIVAQSEQTLTRRQLLSELKTSLPAYMLPNRFVWLTQLPLMPNGKIDRQALCVPVAQEEAETSIAEPTNEVEALLLPIWQQVLGSKRIGIDENFFDLGGHSLLVPQLMQQIRTVFQVSLPLRVLFEAPTIALMARAIDVAKQAEKRQESFERETVNLWKEVALDPTIRPPASSVQRTEEPAALFLTGANGFLGIYLLRELLQQTQATIYCLVRATSIEAAMQRLYESLATYQLETCDLSKRVVVVLGDLAQPLLGLSTEHFQVLAGKIDVIYHCGAWVNFTYPYRVLRATNVGGTHEILRLACQQRVKPVHFISTLDVFSSSSYDELSGQIREEEVSQYSDGLSNGYAESKWVAERIALIARERGVPLAIYRSGLLAGDRQHGVNATHQLIWKLLKGCVELGLAPGLQANINLAPVDYVSKAIVTLSRQAQAAGMAFHMLNPQTFTWKTLLKWLDVAGYKLECVDYEQWRQVLLKTLEDDPEHVLSPFFPIFARPMQGKHAATLVQERAYDQRNVTTRLRTSAIVCPPIDKPLMQSYIASFIERDFLPAPGRESASALKEGRLKKAGKFQALRALLHGGSF